MFVAFLDMQSSKIGLILVLEGIVFHYIWLKYHFGTVTVSVYSAILFQHFCLKNTKLSIKKKKKKKKEKEKKKKPTLIFQYFGSVGKGQTNIFIF